MCGSGLFATRQRLVQTASDHWVCRLMGLSRRNSLLASGPGGGGPEGQVCPSRGPRPPVEPRENIQQYQKSELVALIRWIRSDGRLRTDDEIVEEMVRELEFKRRGANIERTIRNALRDIEPPPKFIRKE
jgi:hypothetical protein